MGTLISAKQIISRRIISLVSLQHHILTQQGVPCGTSQRGSSISKGGEKMRTTNKAKKNI